MLGEMGPQCRLAALGLPDLELRTSSFGKSPPLKPSTSTKSQGAMCPSSTSGDGSGRREARASAPSGRCRAAGLHCLGNVVLPMPQWPARQHSFTSAPLLHSATAVLPALNRWARHRAVGAEHAAVARLRSQHRPAMLALIEELACIGRHDLPLAVTAVRAGEYRFSDKSGHRGTDAVDRSFIHPGRPARCRRRRACSTQRLRREAVPPTARRRSVWPGRQ